MGLTLNKDIEQVVMAADEIGLRLEVVGGVPTWELQPGFRHQSAARKIANSVRPGGTGGDCACCAETDLAIAFPDGSLKRPDIAVFCQEPSELDGVIHDVPKAVVEVVSPGYEAKDWEVGPPFYLSHGVGDVVVFDPRSREAKHFREASVTNLKAPCTVTLLCGCKLDLPA